MKEEEGEALQMRKVLLEEVQNTAQCYTRILKACGGKDNVLDSLIVTSMAANSSLFTFATGQQNFMYEKAVNLNRKVANAKNMGVILEDKDNQELDILIEEMERILNKAIKKNN